MKNRIPKERVIYNNYDVKELYDYAKEYLIEQHKENYPDDEDYEPSDNEVWEEYYFQDSITWGDEKEMIDSFFKNVPYIGFFGEVGLWHGVYRTGDINTDFWKLFNKAIKDCDYVKIWDENGHLYLTCSHHDGTCHFEIKKITDEGYEYYDRWNYGCDNRKESQVMDQIYKRYSRLPNYANKVFGCKKREYEPITIQN